MPGFIFLMPNYLIMNSLGWLDTLLALVVPGAAGAFSVFFLRQFFLALPRELEESALIDGANTWQILTRIILPVSKPALVTLGMLSFLANWNEFIWPVFVLFSPERLTLPAGLSTLRRCFRHRLPGCHGRGDHRRDPGADPVRLRPALHHRRRGEQRDQGLTLSHDSQAGAPAAAVLPARLVQPQRRLAVRGRQRRQRAGARAADP